MTSVIYRKCILAHQIENSAIFTCFYKAYLDNPYEIKLLTLDVKDKHVTSMFSETLVKMDVT